MLFFERDGKSVDDAAVDLHSDVNSQGLHTEFNESMKEKCDE